MRFYLGTDRVPWFERTDIPLFVSHRTLRDRKTFPRARVAWGLDSGGFTELLLGGGWSTPASVYAAAVRRYSEQIGQLAWASPQDWMCEPGMLERTGLDVATHQRLTTENYLELRAIAPDLPFIPVLQGWDRDDYRRHVDAYATAGIDLATAPLVGLGTVCRRQDTRMAEDLVRELAADGLRLHGFGFKILGLGRVGDALTSSDSMAWSYHARRQPGRLCGAISAKHAKCNGCLPWALIWRERVLSRLARPRQMRLW